jgi:hypothetical protein
VTWIASPHRGGPDVNASVIGPSQNRTSRAEYATTIPLPPTMGEEPEAPVVTARAASAESATTTFAILLNTTPVGSWSQDRSVAARRSPPQTARSHQVLGVTFQLLSIAAMSTKYSVWKHSRPAVPGGTEVHDTVPLPMSVIPRARRFEPV